MIRGLDKIFDPVAVSGLKDSEVGAIASEPVNGKRKREFLDDRIAKLEDGQKIFRNIMGGAAV